MAHQRKRHLLPRLEAALRASPIVGLLGHRQVGKTTLLAELTSNYFTLDQRLEREKLESDPQGYLQKRAKRLVALDECQWSADLFPALKEYVRKHPKPGQFLLSGSVRFTSRRAIRESLAGRLLLTELHPLGLRELLNEPMATWPARLLQAKNLSGFALPAPTPEKFHREYLKQLERYLRLGGLPGICLQRDDAARESRHADLLDLMLDRDLRIVLETNLPVARIRAALQALAESNGVPLKLADIQRRSRITAPTLKKLLQAFEALFILRVHSITGGRSAPVAWFEDLGECSMLTGRPASMEHYVYSALRLPFSYSAGPRAEHFQYRTRGGAIVPVCLRTPEGTLGAIAVDDSQVSRTVILSAESFLKAYGDSKVLLVHPGRHWERVSDRIVLVPVSAL